MNRVGDLGFVLGIILTYWTLGTANITELEAIAKAIAKAGYEPVWKDFDQSLLADPTVSEPMQSPEYRIGKIESVESLDPVSIK